MVETTRLVLREMVREDCPAFLRVFSDPAVIQAFGGVVLSTSAVEQWVEDNVRHIEEHGYGIFSVILKGTEDLIGNCGLRHMEVMGTTEVELGFGFHSDYWGQGIATEAALAVRDFGLNRLGLDRFISLVLPQNEAAQRVIQKLGMIREGSITLGGRDFLRYSICV